VGGVTRDARNFVKIDVGFFDHPKVIAAGLHGAMLWLVMVTWSRGQLSDGVVPVHTLGLHAFKAHLTMEEAETAAARLCDVGMLDRHGDVTRDTLVTDHWMIHDYAEHQQTRADINGRREGDAARQRKSRAGRRALEEEAGQEPDGHGGVTRDVTRESRDLSQREKRREEKRKRGGVAVDDGSPQYEICELIAVMWQEHTKLDKPKITEPAVEAVRCLMLYGPTDWDKPRAVPEAEVREMVELVFTKGTEFWPGKNQSWARLVKTGTSLRKFWTGLQNLKEPTPRGRSTNGRSTAVADGGLAATGSDEALEAEFAAFTNKGAS
jgi:hypothetical protein